MAAARVGWWPVVLLWGLVFVVIATGCGGSSSAGSNVTATPSFSPGAGTYSSSQTVTISDATQGAVLYCTTDGTPPTSSSPQCSQPTTVYQSESLQAIAVAPGKTTSAVMSAGYTINLSAVATPSFSPGAGTFTGPQTVTITDATSGANIYYTLDGTTPTSQSTLYTGPVAIASSATLSAIATASGYSNSGVESAAYTIQQGQASTPPSIATLSPSSATAGGEAFALTVSGSNFTSDATVDWGSTALTTTYVSATELTAAVPASLIASAGTVTITVTNSAGASSGSTFTINASSSSPSGSGSATITSLSPSSATVGGPAFTLTVNGANFISGALVLWGNTSLDTTFVSTSQLTAVVPANLIASAGTVAITVSLPDSTTVSAPATFTVSAGTPTIASLLPASALTGGPAFTLTVNGTNFAPGAAVNWGSTALTTTFDSPSVVTAAVPASLIATAGTVAVTVTTSGGASAAANFTVSATLPNINTLTPWSVSAGGAAFTLTINGTNFTSDATVNWGSTALATTYGSAKLLTAAVPASLIASTGSTTITVSETAGPSAGTAFTVSAPGVPTVASLSPSSASAGGAAFTLTVSGTNFTSDAIVNWGSTALTTTYASATQLTAAIPASLIASTGSTTITVAETAGTSASVPFNITPPLPAITGTVVSGAGASAMPLGGASLQLYAAGTTVAGSTGYGQQATAFGSPVTADPQTGAFSVPYDCTSLTPPGDLLYLVATGTNTDMVLMTALGPCGSLSSSGATATINEVTTVASAYALAQFMTTAPNVGAPTSNYQGLSNAFATVNNLVNIATGTALSITPDYVGKSVPFLNTSTAPQMRVNTLANILNSCASAGNSGCSSLLSGTAPSNTLQAILDIAQNPGANVTTLFGLSPASPPFLPALSAAPNDWTLALTFTGGGLGISPSTSGTDSAGNTGVGPTFNTALAIDANGNIWVTGYGEYGYPSSLQPDLPILAEFNNLGKPLTPATQSGASTPAITFGGYNFGQNVVTGGSLVEPASIVIDANQNIWVGDFSSDGNLFTLSPGLSSLASANTGGSIYSLAIDKSGNAWVGGGQGGLNEYTYVAGNSALQQQTLSGAGITQYGILTDLVFDSASNPNLWGADSGNSTVYQISTTSTTDGSALYNAFPSGGNFEVSLVADGTGNVYGCGDSSGTLDVFTATPSPTIANTYTIGSRGCGEQLLLDGQGHLFAISNGFGFPSGANIDEYTTLGTLLSPSPNGYTGTGGTGTGTSGAEPATIMQDINYSPSFFPATAGIDGSGNLWLINPTTSNSGGASGSGPATGNVLVEFVGIAAPVVTPTSVALTNGQLGTRP